MGTWTLAPYAAFAVSPRPTSASTAASARSLLIIAFVLLCRTRRELKTDCPYGSRRVPASNLQAASRGPRVCPASRAGRLHRTSLSVSSEAVTMRRTLAAVELANGVRMPYIEQGDPAARTVLLVH